MNKSRQGTRLQETFDAVADGYDSAVLRFFPESAKHLVSGLPLRGNEMVLDVAAGTGHTALALAARLPHGRVTAVDFSAGMLKQARDKAARMNVHNVEFVERDMQDLSFPAASFDIAVCAFGIFFVEDMATQLAHIAANVKPGGMVAICNFEENYLSPMKELLIKRLEGYGVQAPQQTWKQISHETGCRELFGGAGLQDVHVQRKNMGYFLRHEDQWWDIVWNAGYRRLVGQLAPGDRERFRQEHLSEVAALATPEGIWLDVGVLFTSGVKQ